MLSFTQSCGIIGNGCRKCYREIVETIPQLASFAIRSLLAGFHLVLPVCTKPKGAVPNVIVLVTEPREQR